jgi:hypothetical protein
MVVARMLAALNGLCFCRLSWIGDWSDMNCKAHDWIEHSAFGLGRVSEDRGDRLDIDFINSGAKTILKTAELKPAQSPPDFKFPSDKVKSRTPRFKVERAPRRPPLDFDHLVECFNRFFDGGFDSEDFEKRERGYKEDAAGILKEKLGKDASVKLQNTSYEALTSFSGSRRPNSLTPLRTRRIMSVLRTPCTTCCMAPVKSRDASQIFADSSRE